MLSTLRTEPPVPASSPRRAERRPEHRLGREAREAKRQRAQARVTAAVERAPALSIDRLTPIFHLLPAYRERDYALGEATPLVRYLGELRREVEALEAWAERRGRRAHLEGDAIRQALGFLQSFGRLGSLDYSGVPVEERDGLVTLLALEHRFCYAAAGTTREAFKLAIGRTGAR